MSEQIKSMFNKISRRYDLLNDILSFGIHRFWKKRVIRELELSPDDLLLDVCTGSGDLIFEAKKSCNLLAEPIGVDFSFEMQKIAKSRGSLYQINADAMKLPFVDSTFTALTCSYGIRNVDQPLVALKEFYRVLRSGSRVVVLEFGVPHGVLGFFCNLYSNMILPIIGGFFSKNRDAYSYLPESISKFPYGKNFVNLMESAGFSDISVKSFFFGISYLYYGKKK